MAESIPFEPEVAASSAARIAAAVLIAGSVLEILAMAHHPQVRTHDIAQVITQLRDMGQLSAWVHGILITIMLSVFFALIEFAARRNLARPIVRTGLAAYAIGVAAMTGAALVSGFITPRLAMMNPGVSPGDLQTTGQLLNLCMLFNQACARFAVVAMSAGITMWSWDLVRDAGLERVLGVFGILIGLSCALALMLGALQLDVRGMLLVIVLQAVWTIGIGAVLWRQART